MVAARPNARTWNPSPRTSKPSPKTSKPSPRTLKPSREPPSSASESTYFPFLLRNVGRRRRPKAARSAAQRRRRREAPPRPTARKSLSAEGAIVGPGPLAMNSKTSKHKPTETQMPSCTARENKGRRQQPAGFKNHKKSNPGAQTVTFGAPSDPSTTNEQSKVQKNRSQCPKIGPQNLKKRSISAVSLFN